MFNDKISHYGDNRLKDKIEDTKEVHLSACYFKTCFIHYVDFCSFMCMMPFYVLPN
jgi:hypothetical protein